MARDLNGSSDLIALKNGGIVTAFPFTFATWFKDDRGSTTTTRGDLISQTNTTTNDQLQWLVVDGDATKRTVQFVVRDTGTYNPVIGTADVGDGAWHHGCGVAASATSRTVYTDGGDAQSEAGSYTFAAVDRATIGASRRAATSEFWDGLIAESAIWDVALTAAEVAILAKGFSPLFVRPANLVGYWPLIGKNSPENNVIGDDVGTLTGTVAAAHPRIIYPAPPFSFEYVAAAGGLAIPIAQYHYMEH